MPPNVVIAAADKPIMVFESVKLPKNMGKTMLGSLKAKPPVKNMP
jgi:hypothetical protein